MLNNCKFIFGSKLFAPENVGNQWAESEILQANYERFFQISIDFFRLTCYNKLR